MKSLEKLKSFFIKQHADGKVSFNIGKIVGLVLIAVSNLSAVTLGTLAWFNMSTRDSRVDIVSGDLNVEVKKISAYKYVYPYYKSSTEFIDYDSDGTVKKYVLEDNTLVYNEQSVKDISISADDATIALGTKYGGTGYKTTTIEDANSNMVYIPTANYAPEFCYYLIGDDTFNGVSNSWSLTDGYAFALRESVTNEKHAILDNIVVSQGSSFRLLEVTVSNEQYSYNYYPLNSVTESSAFKIVDDNSDGKGDRLICLRSGIFKITHSPNQLLIELHTKDDGARKDISVISNNSLDPTKVSIDYAGSVDKTDYPTIESYMPTAIYNQNTTMVIDVELAYKNANEIEAGLKVERTAATSNSIFNVAGKYTDTTHNLDGYIDDENQNMLRASDFYNFYAVLFVFFAVAHALLKPAFFNFLKFGVKE